MRTKLSGHSAIVVTIKQRAPKLPRERPVNPEVFQRAECAAFIKAVFEQVVVSHLSAPLHLEFHKSVVREAARAARDAMILKSPNEAWTKWMVTKSIGRAVWTHNILLATRLVLAHAVGRRFLDIDPIGMCKSPC